MEVHCCPYNTLNMALHNWENFKRKYFMKTPIPFAPCHPDPFCPHPIHFKQNVHMLSIEGYMPNVLSHCPTNTISNTDHPLLNFILQNFIVKPHLFF